MQTNSMPDELLSLRDQIDALDDELLLILAKRFEVTARVGKLKADKGLDSVDEEREKQKLIDLRTRAEEKALNPEFVLNLFNMIFAEVVGNHRAYLT
ncbi:MAG: chorismate mutase [SAR86 cluster bacterium]|uniref:chorismate mutase n=1 Tax=SAR86 cluster bacterium TaxID=2030880 RepID=A0A2A5CK52_9GAMM|nr:chorismate mutase [Gammaproteobacteria bacterium AH-315-E17]PCJ43746.1 MAG: chorismate mutase [SAR86 cluster bacterium]